MKKFIYVFSKGDRDRLLKAGFILLKEDKNNEIFTFSAVNGDTTVPDGVEDFMISDTLTF